MTAQSRDILLYNKEELQMAGEPLFSYLNSIKLPHYLVAPSTACWRGYTSKWAIENKKLFLTEWQGYILDYQKVGMDYLFPGEEIVFAKWFTGPIRIEMGKRIKYVHGGYDSVYEGDMLLKFENGVLVEEHTKWLTQEEIDKIQQTDEDFIFYRKLRIEQILANLKKT